MSIQSGINPYLEAREHSIEALELLRLLSLLIKSKPVLSLKQYRKQSTTPLGNMLAQVRQWRELDKLQLCSCSIETWELGPLGAVRFTHLRVINLWGNELESLAGLESMVAPGLKVLVLSANRIVSLRDLRRADFPQLTELYLMQNYIADWAYLSEMVCIHRAKSVVWDKLTLTWISETNTSLDLGFTAKLGPIAKLGYYCFNRIKRPRVMDVLGRKEW